MVMTAKEAAEVAVALKAFEVVARELFHVLIHSQDIYHFDALFHLWQGLGIFYFSWYGSDNILSVDHIESGVADAAFQKAII